MMHLKLTFCKIKPIKDVGLEDVPEFYWNGFHKSARHLKRFASFGVNSLWHLHRQRKIVSAVLNAIFHYEPWYDKFLWIKFAGWDGLNWICFTISRVNYTNDHCEILLTLKMLARPNRGTQAQLRTMTYNNSFSNNKPEPRHEATIHFKSN